MQIIQSGNSRLKNIVNNKVVRHTVYWIFYLVFFATAWGSQDQHFARNYLAELIRLPAKMLLVYWVIYFLFPRYLYHGKIWKFMIFFLGSVFTIAIVQRFEDNYIVLDSFYPDWEQLPIFDPLVIIRTAVDLGSVLVIPVIVKVTKYLSGIQQREQTLAREKLEAELRLLKNQVQPHFLFNTLNSIYALSLKKSNRAPDVILRLSEMLRYMLYETNAPKVDLQKEVECIKSYIELEKIRYGDRIDLSFYLWGRTDGKTIAPMLILPFIENGFKHSTKGFGEETWITLELGIREDELILKIENNVPQQSQPQPAMQRGIGLQNVQRRLDLLYPDRHTLNIKNNIDSYAVFLNLKL
jgi:two-component system LytT family sensor kinase